MEIYDILERYSPIYILYFGLLIGGISIMNDEKCIWKYNNVFWHFFIYNVVGIPACIFALGLLAMGGIFFWTPYCIIMTIVFLIQGILFGDFYMFYIYGLLSIGTLYTFWAYDCATNLNTLKFEIKDLKKWLKTLKLIK